MQPATPTLPRLTEILVKVLGIDPHQVTQEARIEDDLGADTLDLVDICMSAEDAFGIEIPDLDAEICVTVQELATLLDRLVAKQVAL